jgi:hypothetical protein
MNWLAENALPIWMCGAVALTMAFIVYWQTRANGALLGILGVIVATAALLLTNRLIETPREAVERTLYSLAATVEANDVQGALRFLAPSADAELRNDIETQLPLVRIEYARIIGAPQIDVDDGGNTAIVRCRGIIIGKQKSDGMKIGDGGKEPITTNWVRRSDRWLVEGYVSQENLSRAIGRPKNNQAK